jgi:predicted nucleic acid-binding protein
VIIVDTNVITYLAMTSRYTEMAEQLLLQEPEWIVPSLWRNEFRNVLALYMRKSLISFEEALGIQAEMESFMQNGEYDVGSLDVLTLINQSTCSAYDCEFVALARSFNTKLVTMDRKVVKSFSGTAILLTDFITRLQ